MFDIRLYFNSIAMFAIGCTCITGISLVVKAITHDYFVKKIVNKITFWTCAVWAFSVGMSIAISMITNSTPRSVIDRSSIEKQQKSYEDRMLNE